MSQKFIGYLKISKKFTMKKVINNIFFKLMLKTPTIYMNPIIVHRFAQNKNG